MTTPHDIADELATGEPRYRPDQPGQVADQLAAVDAAGDTAAATIQGRPIVVLTMRGARSHLLRRVPLMRVEHEGRYLAVASKGGAPQHPDWFHNLRSGPDVLVQDGTTTHRTRARLLPEEGPERQDWWERAVRAFPPYAEYQERAGRVIPLFVLDPVD